MPEKIAVLCSDVHLSHSPPLARSGEPDWYEAMARPLQELKDLAGDDNVPVLCGGDLFDRWSCPPSLITFAMEMLPGDFNSVMGQHDLPYHSWEKREISAFWTLSTAGYLGLISGWDDNSGLGWQKWKVAWRGFQWGEEIESNNDEKTRCSMSVCVAHQYVWWGDAAHQGAATEKNYLSRFREKLRGYDVVLLGDNHKGFSEVYGETSVFNAGTFMRRHADERDYRPMVGLLLEDGTVEPHYLDVSRDVFDDSETVREAEQVVLNLDLLLDELQQLGETGLDFCRAVEAAMDREQVSRAVRRVVLDAMEKAKNDEG